MCSAPKVDIPDPIPIPPPPPPPRPVTESLETGRLRKELSDRARLGTGQLRVKRPASLNTPG